MSDPEHHHIYIGTFLPPPVLLYIFELNYLLLDHLSSLVGGN